LSLHEGGLKHGFFIYQKRESGAAHHIHLSAEPRRRFVPGERPFFQPRYNIESLAVGETEDAEVSRMTIVVSGDDSVLEQIQTAEQADRSHQGRRPENDNSLSRELFLVKIKAEGHSRRSFLKSPMFSGPKWWTSAPAA